MALAWSIAAHLVRILLLVLAEGELPPIQAVGNFVGADVLLMAHTASALRDDPAQPHLPQQVGLGGRGEPDYRWGAQLLCPLALLSLAGRVGSTLSIRTSKVAARSTVTSSG